MSDATSFTAKEVSEISYQTGWVMIDDHLAAMEAIREAKDREIEGLRAERDHERSERANLLNRVYRIQSENTAMYGAILEAADMGSVRCKLELQRIAAEDAGRSI